MREEGADGLILVVGREPDPPYHRPPLSKGYLGGDQGRVDALLRPDGWWVEQEIELQVRSSAMSSIPASAPRASRESCPRARPASSSARAGWIACSSGLGTSIEGIFAPGTSPSTSRRCSGGRSRIEHWDGAREHGRTAARNMLGRDVAHEAVPYFWSDLAEWASLEYVSVGALPPGEPVRRGSLEYGAFSAFWLAETGRLAAALVVGRPGELEEARRMIAERASPDRGSLADAGPELSSA